MTKAELLKLLEKYGDDVDFPGVKFPGDDFPRSKKNGFDFNGSWIDNPIYDETGRFPFKSMQDSISHYGDTNADAIRNMYKELGELVGDDEPTEVAPEAKVEEKVEVEDPFKDLKTVYTTSDDTGLVWNDPVAFKKFVIGPLIAGFPKEEREAALKSYWKMSPEELVNNDKLTGGSYDMFDATATDDSGAVTFDPYNKELTWDVSLRDLYNSGDDTDPFDNDLYDLLDNFNGDIEDVNGDGDPDVMTEDTDGDGEADTATVTADDEAEASEAVDSAKTSLDDKKVEQDSTGSLNDKPSEDVSDEKLKDKKSSGCVSDEKVKDKKHPEDCSCAECTKKKEQELSDSRFKNIVNTLVDKLW